MSYLTFRRFQTIEEAENFGFFLRKTGIDYQISDESPVFDPSFANTGLDKDYHIKLSAQDFEKAEEALANESDNLSFEHIPTDYYLLEFKNDELIEILMKPDEWGSTDYSLSKVILKERGMSIDTEFLETLRNKRIEALSKPAERQKTWISAGYLFALLGGLLGLFIGWHLASFKKTLPNGTRVFGYQDVDRKHGKYIIALSVLFLLINIGIWIFEELF